MTPFDKSLPPGTPIYAPDTIQARLIYTAQVTEDEIEYLKLFARHSVDTLVVYNVVTQRLEFLSPSFERLTGLPVEKAMILPLNRLMDEESYQRFHPYNDARTRLMLETPEIIHQYSDELTLYRLDGSTFPAEVFTHYLQRADGSPIAVAVLRDITDRKNYEASLVNLLEEQTRRERAEKALIHQKEEFLRQELEKRRSELVTMGVTIAENNTLAIDVLVEISQMVKSLSKEAHDAIRPVIQRFKKKQFQSRWPGLQELTDLEGNEFLALLQRRHPRLTKLDRQLCMLIRLNLTNNDIAHLTSSAYDAIRKARTRLRKKLGIAPDIDLSEYLQSLHSA